MEGHYLGNVLQIPDKQQAVRRKRVFQGRKQPGRLGVVSLLLLLAASTAAVQTTNSRRVHDSLFRLSASCVAWNTLITVENGGVPDLSRAEVFEQPSDLENLVVVRVRVCEKGREFIYEAILPQTR